MTSSSRPQRRPEHTGALPGIGRHLFALAAVASFLGCSPATGSKSSTTDTGGGSPNNVTGGGNGGLVLPTAGGPVLNVPTSSGGSETAPGDEEVWPSPACVGAPADAITGQYCQGPAHGAMTQDGTISNATGCGTTLWGIARDFIGYNQMATQPPGTPHPDFGSHYCCGNPLGTVLATLGSDDKPVYNPANVAGDYNANGVGLTGPDAFDQWYRDVPGVNLSYLVGFHLVPADDGVTQVFASKLYFPVDGVGFGNFNDYGEDGKSHNFGFTTELHTKFKYRGGEVFSFEGDDDLWVFIDKKLAMDSAGIHSAMQGQIKLDELATSAGLVIDQVYSFDLFQAERHPSGSNFKITTSMTFVDCGVDPVVR